MIDNTLAILGGNPIVAEHKSLLDSWPIVTEKDMSDLVEVLQSKEFSGRNSPIIKNLEKKLEDYLKANNVILISNGTAALHSCIAALGIGAGDEVIVPSFTFLASAISALHNCAIPVFCDIDENTFNIDPAKIESLISDKTKAIMVVHMQGLPADMDRILELAKKAQFIRN